MLVSGINFPTIDQAHSHILAVEPTANGCEPMCIIIRKKTFLLFIFTLSVFVFFQALPTTAPTFLTSSAQAEGYVCIIIDDFGNNGNGTKEILSLPIPITVAVMPFLPFSLQDAEAAYQAGKEVFLHVPMEPLHGKPSWLGPKAITNDLSDEEIRSRLQEALKEIKWATGLNNHMGSKIMENKRIVKTVLALSKENHLIFVDSKTTQKTVAPMIAEEIGTTYFCRDVFLDNVKNKRDIENRLSELGNIALEKGYAIGIGHVGPEGGIVTAQAIQSMIPVLEKKGIRFVTMKELQKVIAKDK